MESQYLRIKISPEVIKNDYSTTEVSGVTYSIISGMSQVLSGGTNGDSLLTDLSIPVILNQSVHDFGYYDGFDGDLLQKDVVTNFVFSQEVDSYSLTLFNTSQNSGRVFSRWTTNNRGTDTYTLFYLWRNRGQRLTNWSNPCDACPWSIGIGLCIYLEL